MPTSTFYNLPQEKRQKLTQAIFAEYSRVAPDEVSINRIVCAAGIPRGSYYQYFTSKDDLLDFVLSECRNRILFDWSRLCSIHQGHLESLLLALYDRIIEQGNSGENAALFRNVFAHARAHGLPNAKPIGNFLFCNQFSSYFIEQIAGTLCFSNEQEAIDLYEILLGLIRWAVASTFCNLSQRDAIRQSLKNKIKILRCGIECNIVKNKEAHSDAC